MNEARKDIRRFEKEYKRKSKVHKVVVTLISVIGGFVLLIFSSIAFILATLIYGKSRK